MLCKRYSNIPRVLALVLMSCVAVSCGTGDGPAVVVNQSPQASQAYSLVWSDEFDQGSAPDVNKWRIETGYGDNGWGNQEWQLYTDSPDNLRVENGNLVITALCSSSVTAPADCNNGATADRTGIITSARINTKDKYEVKYGKIQARIKVPPGKGTWPAFWMLGSVFPEQPWPGAGEIDIVEIHQFYSDINTTHFAMHWCDDSRVTPPEICDITNGRTLVEENKTFDTALSDDYHIYEAEWDENRILGKIDGITYFNKTIDPETEEEFLGSFFMILNVAVGGTLGGPPNTSTTWPQEMLVDWVRVYKKSRPVVLELIPEDLTTASAVYEEIVNSVIFGGDSVVADINSKAVTPLVGDVVLEFDYKTANTFFSGGAFAFKSIDLSDYTNLVFSIDLSAFPNFDDIGVEMVDSRNSGNATGKVSLPLVNYTRTVSGNWLSYEIPLSDFNGVNLDNVTQFGFWNPVNTADQLIAGKLYIDDIRFMALPCTTTASVAFDSDFYNPSTSVASVTVDDVCAASSLAVVNIETDSGEIGVGVDLDAAGNGKSIFNLAKTDSVCDTNDAAAILRLPDQTGLLTATYSRTDIDADGTQQISTSTDVAGVDPTAPGTTIIGEKAYFYATDPGQAISFLPDTDFEYSIFGSGSVLDGNFSDTTYDPVFAVTSGTSYGGGIHVAQVALIGGASYPGFTGFSAGKETINFKAKNLPNNTITVEFGVLGGASQARAIVLTSSPYSTAGIGGWFEVSIPMTEFPNASVNNFMVFTAGNGGMTEFTFLITDIFLQESAGNLPAECDNVITPPVLGSGTGATGATGGPLSISFDDSLVTYSFIGFGSPDTSTILAADPLDIANTVAVTTKPASAQVWAGVTVASPALTYPLPSTSNDMTIRIYSPGAGLVVHMKLEDSTNGANYVEAEAVATVDIGWETLTFDFDNPVAGSPAINAGFTYDKLSLFFGFGSVGDGTAYTWDTIEFLP